jgi:hypothetical protein
MRPGLRILGNDAGLLALGGPRTIRGHHSFPHASPATSDAGRAAAGRETLGHFARGARPMLKSDEVKQFARQCGADLVVN